jgi:hypothetical protein
VFSKDYCENLITQFEQCGQQHREIPTRLIELDLLNLVHNSKSLLGSKYKGWKTHNVYDFTADTDLAMQSLLHEFQLYKDRWDTLNKLPDTYTAEGFRIKAYRPGVHQFKMHVDVGNRISASRFLGFLIYLNDSDAGTEYPQLDMTIEARQGRMVLFPPMWMYPHRGEMPSKHSKYIMSTYLQYDN